MKFKSIVCLLLLVSATANGLDDEWSWGVEAKDSPDSSSLPIFEEFPVREGHSLAGGSAVLNIDSFPLEDKAETFVHEVLPLETEDPTYGLRSLPLTSETLPLGPQGTVSLSVIGEGEVVDGLVVAEGDREGRFLGLSEKLCSYGIGINCAKKYPAPVKSHYGPPNRAGPNGAYGLPKPAAPQADYGLLTPIRTQYSPPRPAFPQGTYGSPQSLPPPPVFPDRNYNPPTPTKAPFSPLNGLLSVLKPLLPTYKPKAPPKVSQGGVLSPSYTAPNPNYAPLLPSYTPPIKPAYVAPTPSYVAPPSVYYQPKPAYVAPKPAYVAPKPAYVAPKPAYVAHKPSYVAPAVHVVHTKPVYTAPKPVYAPPKPSYDDVQPSYSAPKRVYVEPKPAYVNSVPTVTVHAQPTVVEQHHHTHTHVYNDQTVHEGIYKNDHNGVLQSVHDSINQVNQHTIHRQDINRVSTHDTSNGFVQIAQPLHSINQVNQHTIHRQDINRVSTHGTSNGIAQIAQPSINHAVQQQLPAIAPSTPSIVPAVLVGGINFQPGKIESGFKPLHSILDPIFRPQQPAYREDCQCVAVAFCSDQDVIARNAPADYTNVIDARTRGSDIFSNATDSEEDTTVDLTSQRSARRGKVLDIFDESLPDFEEVTEEVAEEATEEATEEVTEAATEASIEFDEETTQIPVDEMVLDEEDKSRVRRDANITSEDTEDSAEIYSDRQGRQLTGFTPDTNGCGPNYVCCRRPVFKPRRQRYTCGKRNAAGLLGRVKTAHFVQGDTEFGEYPWQAAILKRENGDNLMYQCGGTLIDDKHVLTAAHCVDGLHPSQLKIRLGEWDVSGQTEFYQHVEMRASGVYLHPEFYAGNLNNDIAVIRLEDFVDFSSNPHITPVCLPGQFSDFTNHRCQATGWGKDAFGSSGKFSQILKAVEIPIMENQLCQQSLQRTRLGTSFTLHEGNLCAGGEENRDTCKGDGGGPLVCSGPDGSIQLVGLVSWGIGCGHPGVPGVYVKVAHYLNWIREITRV